MPLPERRLTSVDALRGAVMVIMALDHAREFLHVSAASFQPDDVTRTTVALFFTRWITHVCAPTFMLLAGMGAWLRLRRDGSPRRVARFLWTRGLWLIAVEIVVMRLAMNFTLGTYPVMLLVLTALGVAMIALAACIGLPPRVIGWVGVAILLLHNLLDPVQAAQLGALAPVWTFLHQPGIVMLGGTPVFVAYSLLPWTGVMFVGFWAGGVFDRDPVERRRILVRSGLALVAGFVLLRLTNVYGDPQPWSQQPSPIFTILSFLRVTKYPPSLAFVLMTLGPALVLLASLDGRRLPDSHPLVVFGRVPFFFYVAHFFVLHAGAWIAAWIRYGGQAFRFLFAPFPSMGGPPALFPERFGYPLWGVYVGWLTVVVALYPACRWFAAIKATRRSWWTGYL